MEGFGRGRAVREGMSIYARRRGAEGRLAVAAGAGYLGSAMASDRRAELTLAKSYPHDPPAHSFLYAGGAAWEIVEPGADGLDGATVRADGQVMPAAQALAAHGIAAAPMAERTAVIAHGSNASPARLERKFADLAGDTVFPVIRADLDDHDVVYSSHFSRTGSIPATLAASPATRVTVAITYLTAGQLARMHETELGRPGQAGNYHYARLYGIRLEPRGLAALDAAHVYLSRHGMLGVDSAPVALAALAALGRRYPAATPAELLPGVCDRLARGRAIDDLLREIIDDAGYRKACNERLRAAALAPSVERVEWVEPAPAPDKVASTPRR